MTASLGFVHVVGAAMNEGTRKWCWLAPSLRGGRSQRAKRKTALGRVLPGESDRQSTNIQPAVTAKSEPHPRACGHHPPSVKKPSCSLPAPWRPALRLRARPASGRQEPVGAVEKQP